MDYLSSGSANRSTGIKSQSALAPPPAGSPADQLSEYVPRSSSPVRHSLKSTKNSFASSSFPTKSSSSLSSSSSSPSRTYNTNQYSSIGVHKKNANTGSKLNSKASSHLNANQPISAQEIDAAFQLVDANQDGTINASELQHMLSLLGLHADCKLVDQMIADIVPNGSGLLDKRQFERLLGRFAQVKDRDEDMQRDLRAAFQVFDRDGNGFLSRDELSAAMRMLGEPLTELQIDQLMHEIDLDRDGRIDFNEFCTKFRQLF